MLFLHVCNCIKHIHIGFNCAYLQIFQQSAQFNTILRFCRIEGCYKCGELHIVLIQRINDASAVMHAVQCGTQASDVFKQFAPDGLSVFNAAFGCVVIYHFVV